MLHFIKKILFFVMPLSVIFVFPMVVVFLGKEYMSVVDVVKIQNQNSEILYGPAYNGLSTVPYKKLLFETKNPTVLAIGTSRVMQIRKEFFIKPDTFVNVSTGGMSLADMEIFIKELPSNSNVKMVILGLDQATFYEHSVPVVAKAEPPLPVRILDILSLSRRMYLDYFLHKYSLSELVDKSRATNNIGIFALAYENGFRSDGSYKYGQPEINPNRLKDVEAQVALNVETITKKGNNESYEDAYIKLNLEKLDNLLLLCKKKGITVIGFMPPYPQYVYQTMLDKGGLNREMITNTPKKVENVFYMNGFTFYNLSSPLIFGGKDTEFVDSIHGTDVMSLQMMIYIGEHTKDINQYINLDYLRDISKKTKGDFLSF